VPGLQRRTDSGAERFTAHAEYVAGVLHGKAIGGPPGLPYDVEQATTESVIYGLGAGAIAVATAAFGLWYRRLPEAVRRAGPAVRAPVEVVRGAHTGIIGDYLVWIVAGTAVIGGIWAFTLT